MDLFKNLSFYMGSADKEFKDYLFGLLVLNWMDVIGA